MLHFRQTDLVVVQVFSEGTIERGDRVGSLDADRADDHALLVDTYDLGQYAVLDEGKTYSIQVRQYSNLGSYCMKIGFQKPSTDITGYSAQNFTIN